MVTAARFASNAVLIMALFFAVVYMAACAPAVIRVECIAPKQEGVKIGDGAITAPFLIDNLIPLNCKNDNCYLPLGTQPK